MIDLEAWAEQEKLRVDAAKADLARWLIALTVKAAEGGRASCTAIRELLTAFEETEMGFSGDLELLRPFYDALGQEEYGWGEASDEEVAAARKAFGGDS